MKKKIIDIFFATFLVYLCVVAALYCLQRKMIFYPDTTTPQMGFITSHGFETFNVKTKDGIEISGLWRKANKEKPTLVFFHGNAGHHGHRIYNVQSYIDTGYGIVLAGYRGYGGNIGAPSEEGFYHDARAYIDYLLNDDVKEEDIILYGQSIGSGVAVQMATEFKNVQALILEAPYTSLPDVAAKTYFFIPVHWLMKDRFNNLSKISKVKAPLLIMHGSKDLIIPVSHGKKLYEAVNEPKEINIMDGFGHNNLPLDKLSTEVMVFVKSTKKRTE